MEEKDQSRRYRDKIKYYKVIVKGGHVGNGRSVLLTFHIRANDIFEAEKIARRMPCVKHDNVKTIWKACEITKEEYEEGRKACSAYDIYNKIEVKK